MSNSRSLLAVMPLLIFAATGVARADDNGGAGDNIVSFGWLHIKTADQGSPQTTTLNPAVTNSALGRLAGVPGQFTSPGTQLSVSGADTATMIFTHFFTEHFAVQMVAGYPPTFKLYGNGSVTPPSNLPAVVPGIDTGNPRYQPLVKSVRLWSPAMVFTYYFNDHNAHWRPFFGIGVTYAWFEHTQFDNDFLAAQEFSGGPVNVLAPKNTAALLSAAYSSPADADPVAIKARASSHFAPVFNAGVDYRFLKNVHVEASLSYVPLRTNTSLDFVDTKTGAVLAQSTSRLILDDLVTTLTVGYRFRL